MSQSNLKILTNELLEIKKQQFVKSLRKSSTGIGFTLETLLGLKENRIPESDWGAIELKTMRANSKSDISLFVIDPFYYDIRDDSEFIDLYGYPNIHKPEIKSFIQTIKYTLENKRNWKLGIDYSNEKLLVLHKRIPVGEIRFKAIQKRIESKLTKLVSILADVETDENCWESFWFNKAFFHEGCTFELFLKSISSGYISLNPRMRKLPDGKITKHGTAFRIKRNYFNSIFKKSVILF